VRETHQDVVSFQGGPIVKLAAAAAFALVCCCRLPACADEPDSVDPKCKEFGKAYVLAKFGGPKDILESSLAEEIILLPGHEYLKKDYGINPSGDRDKQMKVSRGKLIDLDQTVWKALPDAKKIPDMLDKSVYTFVVASGESTEFGGQMKLPTLPGDVVMKVKPEQRDDNFMLYVLRRLNAEWKVVMDYTD
jgi:hypothetical protein